MFNYSRVVMKANDIHFLRRKLCMIYMMRMLVSKALCATFTLDKGPLQIVETVSCKGCQNPRVYQSANLSGHGALKAIFVKRSCLCIYKMNQRNDEPEVRYTIRRMIVALQRTKLI